MLPIFDALYDSKQIRTILPRHEQGAVHMADGYARATGRCGVGARDERSGRDQHGHGHRQRLHGLDPDGGVHRPGGVVGHRHRRVPGVRHHRHHAADHQAQLPRQGRGRPSRGHQGGVLHRHDRPARSGAHRRPRRREQARDRLRVARRASTCPATSPRSRATAGRSSRPPSSSPRARRPLLYAGGGVLVVGGVQGAQGARRAHAASGRRDAHGQGLLPGGPPPERRDAGHARRQVHQLHHHRDRPAHRGGRALRRPRDRQALERSRARPRSSTSTSTPPRSARTSSVDVPIVGDAKPSARRARRRAAQDRRRAAGPRRGCARSTTGASSSRCTTTRPTRSSSRSSSCRPSTA